MVVFSTESIMIDLLPRCFGYCAVDQTRRRFCQRRWPRTPATPPIANRADRIFETLKKCGLNWGVSVLRRAVEKANHRHGPRRRTAECGQQFPPSDGERHTPLPCEVRTGTIPRHERAVLTARHPARAGRTPGSGCNGAPPDP